ncbi:MAG: dicarboxylate/amino acid:cation symporter [Pirellulales bacterium]
MSGAQRVFGGLIAGAAAGLCLARFAPQQADMAAMVARPIGTLWLHGLQMTVVPLVVSLLVVGVTQAADIATTGRIARRAMLWMLVLATGAAIVTAVLAPLLLSLCLRSPDLVAALQAASGMDAAPTTVGAGSVTSLLPTNVVAAAAQGAVAPLVVFTLCFAFALTRISAAHRDPVVAVARGVADAMTVIVNWVLLAGPLGVFALILPVAVRAGGGVLGALGIYVALLVAVYLTITALVYAVVWLGEGESLYRFAAAVLPAQVVAASTQSSLASVPAMLAVAHASGCPPRVSGLVLPLAVSLFRVTSPAQYVAVTSFIAWAYGIEPAPGTLAVAALLAVVIRIGSVGLPGQANFMGTNLPVVQAAGLPVEPLGLLLAIDLIPDVFATVGNVTADLAVVNRVAAAERGSTKR